VVAILVKLLASSEIAMAVCLLVGTRCYLRPCELTSLRRGQLVRPQLMGGNHFKFWAVNLHPETQGKMSKTGYFDESIVLDDASGLTFLSPFLEILREGDPSSPLWPFKHVQLVQRFAQCSQQLGLDKLHCCLYALRHAGASADWLTRARSLQEIKTRGRWVSDASLRRYQKAAVAQKQLELMPTAVQTMASSALDILPRIFHSPELAQHLLRQLVARPI
jgi:hypothetical protein